MPVPPHVRTVLVQATLELLPPSIRESLISDPAFINRYEIPVITHIAIGEDGISVQGSQLYSCIREVLTDSSARPTLKDESGKEWWLELVKINNEHWVGFSDGKRRFLL